MAESVGSAVIQEAANQVLSSLVQKYKEKEESDANINLERLEMAHIRLEAALEVSDKWQITDTSLRRWRRKLKRVAQECDDTLQKCKQKILEDEQMEHEVRNSSLPNRIVHATKSFVSSIFNHDENGLSRPVVQRFEWYADGASEFLRFIEFCGTPHCRIPFASITKNLLAGKEVHHKITCGNGYPLLQLWLSPYRTAEHGTEASLVFIKKDCTTPAEGSIHFSMIVQLSESTDIVGIAVKSLQLFAPHVKHTVESIRNELAQLPTQDFSWAPPVYSHQKQHWDKVHSLGSQWYRPDPLCCKQHDQREVQHFSNLDMPGSSDSLVEPLIQFNLQWQVPLSVYCKQNTSVSEKKNALQGSPYLKAGVMFAPHGSSHDILPANHSSVAVAIVGREQHLLHEDIALEQLEETMLPKAIDYFCLNAEETVYQMIWESKHGIARIQVEKPIMSTRQTFRGSRKRRLLQGEDQELRSRTQMICHLIDLWVRQRHVPVRLQKSFINWMQKEKEIQSGSRGCT